MTIVSTPRPQARAGRSLQDAGQAHQVVEWHDTNRVFFNDPKHRDEAAAIIRRIIETR
jgi:hypothetical protein